MKTLISKKDSEYSRKKLQKIYNNIAVPNEKKEFLINVNECYGPYLATNINKDQTKYIFDMASQIASLGNGFSHSSFWGVTQNIESWTNEKSSKTVMIEKDFLRHLNKQLGFSKNNNKSYNLVYTNSGAESNETALIDSYKKRKNLNANKILAFEGSFHGRTMLSLFSTWNKSKREDFQWKGLETVFVSYPEDKSANEIVEYEKEWVLLWGNPNVNKFSNNLKKFKHRNEKALINKEIDTLIQVRQHLESKNIYAIMIEPMQCEGGDKYSTNRFHLGLISLAKAYEVSIIYDEVQTGFNLGDSFFWHYKFLEDCQKRHGLNIEMYRPDYIVCAKKSQIGLVLSKHQIINEIEPNKSSLLRGYIHSLNLEQLNSIGHEFEKITRDKSKELVIEFKDFIENPRSCGFAFSIDLKDSNYIKDIIALRFEYGLMYYPAGTNTLRFRLNTSIKEEDINYFFKCMNDIFNKVFKKNISGKVLDFKMNYKTREKFYQNIKVQDLLLKNKLNIKSKNIDDIEEEMVKIFNLEEKIKNKIKITRINESNFDDYCKKIKNLQEIVYEPLRRTELSKFKKCVLSQNSINYIIEEENNLIGICFSSNLNDHKTERGALYDKDRENAQCLYIIDTTVDPRFKGFGIGRLLKSLVTAVSLLNGYEFVKGRNRDKLAYPMLDINLFLGAVVENYIEQDYLDLENFNDCFYYSIDNKFETNVLNLSSYIEVPLDDSCITEKYVLENKGSLINKLCLSNFINTKYMSDLTYLFDQYPVGLRHGYTASGHSECIDKIVKSIWLKRAPRKKMLTLEGSFFGDGTMISSSLSGNENNVFKVDIIKTGNLEDLNRIKKITIEIENKIKSDKYLAFFLEPYLLKTIKKVPFKLIKEISRICKKYKTPLVMNETLSSLYRYNEKYFSLSCVPGVKADIVYSYLGGQMGIILLNKNYYEDTPLKLISTWDGDETSLYRYVENLKQINKNLKNYNRVKEKFTEKINKDLKSYDLEFVNVENACGTFKGIVSPELSNLFEKNKNGSFKVLPNLGSMKKYLKNKVVL
jgi:acetylornithine/succinyldiaminopimelate/putrescine aminotransferase